MVSGGMTVVKYLLFIFNVVFFVSGISLIIVGALVQSSLNHYDGVVEEHSSSSSAVLLIVVGSIVTVVAFLGCCGAIRENHCMVVTFAVFLGIIFILELISGISAFVYKDDLKALTIEQFNVTWSKYNHTGNEELSKNIDIIQNELHCCGVNGSEDWVGYPWSVENPDSVPDSCCKTETKGCGKDALKTKKDIYSDGCYEELKDVLADDAAVVAGVGIGLAFIQLVGIVFAWCLAGAIRRKYEMV